MRIHVKTTVISIFYVSGIELMICHNALNFSHIEAWNTAMEDVVH